MKHKSWFEYWVIGSIKRERLVLDHYLTHDDIEAHLHYSNYGDLIWRDASDKEIPTKKHQNAIEMEETIKRGVFCDFMEAPESSVTTLISHISSVSIVGTTRKINKASHPAIIGRWTDDVITFNLQPNNKLEWSCTDPRDPLNVGERVHGHAPDWWNFGGWHLYLMNDEYKCGTHVSVFRISDTELHLPGNVPHRIARIFRRVA